LVWAHTPVEVGVVVKPVGQRAGAVEGEALVKYMERHVLKRVVVQRRLGGGMKINYNLGSFLQSSSSTTVHQGSQTVAHLLMVRVGVNTLKRNLMGESRWRIHFYDTGSYVCLLVTTNNKLWPLWRHSAVSYFIYTTVQKFGVIQTISCLP